MEASPALKTGVGSDAMSARHGAFHLLVASQTAHCIDVSNLQVDLSCPLPNDYSDSAISILL